MIKRFLYKWLLKRLLSKACEDRIPRSGKEAEKVNCYVVAFDIDNSPFYVATSIYKDTLSGFKWDGSRYSIEESISISDLENGKLNITHYYGLSEVTYDSLYDAIWHHITKIVYIKIRLYRHIDSTHQYFFNKRKLVTKKRMDLLRFMMSDQIERTHDGIDSLDLMTKIYSLRLFLHPSWETQHKVMEMYLDSLVESGELKRTNSEYVVTGKAISTIEKYEEEERRHTEAVKLQKKMFWLTKQRDTDLLDAIPHQRFPAPPIGRFWKNEAPKRLESPPGAGGKARIRGLVRAQGERWPRRGDSHRKPCRLRGVEGLSALEQAPTGTDAARPAEISELAGLFYMAGLTDPAAEAITRHPPFWHRRNPA